MNWSVEYIGEYSFTEDCVYIKVFVYSDIFNQGRDFLLIRAFNAKDARMKLERYLIDNNLEPYFSVLNRIEDDFVSFFK